MFEMDFKSKYTNDKVSEPEKTAVSSEAYLNAEMIDSLIKALERLHR